MSPAPVILAQPERPFWGFAEVFLIAALFLPAVAAGGIIIQIAASYLGENATRGLPLLIAEFIGYGIIFLILRVLFARYHQPLLKSLAWVPQPFKPGNLVVLGFALAGAVVILGNLLRTPNTQTPFDKLLSDPVSRIAIAIFGITLGPIVEELLFRGFLQPVLVASMGVLPGILVTAAVFGAMHLVQNAFIWQSGVLIMLVGFVLGVVRHVSGSTRASAVTHISYNALPFFAVLLERNPASPK